MTTEIPAGAESPVAHSGKPSDSAALRSSVAAAAMLALSVASGPVPAQSAPSAPVSASAKARSPLLASVPAAGSPERLALEEEMFAAFGSFGLKSASKASEESYRTKLAPGEQAKVLAYYQAGKSAGTDLKKLKFGTYDVAGTITTANDIQATAKAYRDTGKLDHATNQKLTALWDRALLAVPSAAGLFDRVELDRIYRLWNSVLDANLAKLDERIAKSEKRIKELDELNAIFESIRKTL